MLSEKVLFERLTTEDINGMREVIEVDGKEFDSRQIFTFLADPAVLAFKAELESKIIGAIYAYSLTKINCEPMLYIHDVGILPEYQNKGIGSAMIKYVIEYARTQGFSKCFLVAEKKNARACRIYEKAGGICETEGDTIFHFRF